MASPNRCWIGVRLSGWIGLLCLAHFSLRDLPAADPDHGGVASEPHWAYLPVSRPAVPTVLDASWPRNPIDHFVLAKLEAAKTAPSPEADRYTLIRRLYLDLLGLPPDPEEADRFAADSRPDAWERLVDRLLASPHFGERWGRHWLDVARYADSDGYEKDRARPDAWRYRDWVIRAINEDMPFDRFTIEQIAGDLLPEATTEQIVATAFHRQTLTNDEGGVDKEQYRVEAVFDRVETVGTVWLGLTVGCARCHSHKYDRLSQREYYQLYAFFNNGDEVTRQAPVTPDAWRAYKQKHGANADRWLALQRRLADARARFAPSLAEWENEMQAKLAEVRQTEVKAEFKPLAVRSVTASGGATLDPLSDGSWASPGPGQQVVMLEAVRPEDALTMLRIEFPDPLDTDDESGSARRVVAVSEVRVRLGPSFEEGRPVRFHSPQGSSAENAFPAGAVLDGNARTAWVTTNAPENDAIHSLTLHLVRPLPADSGGSIWMRLENRSDKMEEGFRRIRLLGSSDVTEESLLPASIRRTLAEEPARRPIDEMEALAEWAGQWDDEILKITDEIERLGEELGREGAPPLMEVRVLAERIYSPRTTRVLSRGDFLSPGEAVEPGTPAILPPLDPAKGPVSGSRSAGANRLDLARWLVDPVNPLTPRVVVNRWWMRLFGEALVRTVEDFGVRGEKPTHPALLDWLASELVSSGWSRKHLIRLMVTSAAYRQSAAHRPELEEIDPQNRLIHRQARMRVEAEIVRDLNLAVSGLLTRRIGGPSVFPPMPPEVAAVSYANNFRWNTSRGANRYRRGMYTFFKRTAPHPDLMTFDCPDANVTAVRRHVSNTPLQALTTLNAEAFAEAARGLALRILREPADGSQTELDRDRMVRAFRLCIARPPADREVESLRELLAGARAYYSKHAEEARELAGGDAGRLPAPAEEVAAWTATTRILMNLDEFMTRE